MEKYIKPSMEVLEMELEGQVLTASTKEVEIDDSILLDPEDAY